MSSRTSCPVARLVVVIAAIALPRLATATPAAPALVRPQAVSESPVARPEAAERGALVRAQPDAVSIADSLAAGGDTAQAMKVLERALRADRRDARAWHRIGMLSWEQARSARNPDFIQDQKQISLLIRADSSLRWATIHAPDSAQFFLDLGHFLLESDVGTLRFSAMGFLRDGLAAARRTGNDFHASRLADEVGLATWRRYETQANRWIATGPPPDLGRFASERPREVGRFLEQYARKARDFSGEADYLRADEMFREALELDPNNASALKHRFMVLAETARWAELEAAARHRLTSAPWDPWAWLGVGLAAHRLGRVADASAAFDSAMVFLTAEDRGRYDRLGRVLSRKDAARIDTASNLDVTKKLYWLMSDPLWLAPGNEVKLEFLARIAYSEFRWSDDSRRLKGADTDRGEIHVRYGPPSTIASFSGETNSGHELSPTVVWFYPDGLSFVFRQPPGFGTASIHGDFRESVRNLIERAPVQWGNVLAARFVDSIDVQVARFRGRADSTDVFVVARIPYGGLVSDVGGSRSLIDVDFQLFDGYSQRVTRDSSRDVSALPLASPDRVRAWRSRVGRGFHLYRVEALEAASQRGARAVGQMTIPADTGFAMSSVLLATRVLPKEGTAGERWSDFNIVPSTGRYRAGEPVALLWETYELRRAAGGSRYRVSITLTPVRRGGVSGLATRVLGAAASSVVGQRATGTDKVTLTYERQAPGGDVVLDHLSLDLSTAAPGDYTLVVEVTDLATQRKASRTSRLTIVE